MIFIETPTFTRLIVDLLDDDEYSKMQTELAKRPDVGDLIKNGGGIRKETTILRNLVKEL